MTEFSSLPLTLDPSTLMSHAWGFDAVDRLYDEFAADLASLTAQMADHRRALTAAGYSCDFSDRESELLYLLVRATKPETVVEISPCHGYSTNYILAALTQNGRGELHSYEIVPSVHGKPTDQTIRDNQLPRLDLSRLHVHIGDATLANIPSADFLFLDSAHEAWFASWYFTELVPQAGLCMVHDIVIDQPGYRTLVPKGPFMGIRESIHVLETLSLNQQRALSVAAFGRARGAVVAEKVTERNPGAPERSIVFLGHEQSPDALAVHRAALLLRSLQHRVIDGDRSVVREIQQLLDERPLLYGVAAGGTLFALAGYRDQAMRSEFQRYFDRLLELVATGLNTVSDFVAALEVGAQLASPELVSTALHSGRKVLPAPIVRFYANHYREYGLSYNRSAGRVSAMASRVRGKLVG